MPTGVAIRDAREQLFDAAERVLLRDGPNALTSRAVTTEAGCAKGVLHRHFADFDAFLAELVLDRIARLDGQAAALRAAAGTGTVAGNLTGALMELFGSVALAIVSLVISRDELRARLRQARPAGIPLLTEATAMIASYLDHRARTRPDRRGCRRGHARAHPDRRRAPALRRPGRHPARGWSRPQGRDHGHRRGHAGSAAMNGPPASRSAVGGDAHGDWSRYWRSADEPLEAMHAHFREHVYHRHSHDTYSFGVTESGAQSFTCRGAAHTSAAGMVMAFNPDDPHDGHATTGQGFSYRMIHIGPGLVTDVLADIGGRPAGRPLFATPVVADPALAARCDGCTAP